jgi:hypothetical protein
MFRSDRRGRGVAALAATSFLLPLSAAGAAPSMSSPPACELVIVSPAYSHDHVLLCTYRTASNSEFEIGVSGDAGHSWRTPAMVGLVQPSDGTGTLTLTISPSFASDHMLFATTESGTYASSDLAESFTALDPLIKSGVTGNPMAFVAPTRSVLSGPAPTVQLAFASTRTSGVYDVDARLHEPVTGVPGRGALRFLVSPVAGSASVSLAFVDETDPLTADDTLAVYRCDTSLTCAERLFAFPSDLSFAQGTGRLQLTPDGRTIVVTLAGPMTRSGQAVEVWRSTDGGRTFGRWSSLEKLLSPVIAASGQTVRIGLAVSPTNPKRAYLRVQGARPPRAGWSSSAPPALQLFRTDDGGATWRRVAYGLGVAQRGAKGTLPWVNPARGQDSAQLLMTSDGRLFAVGGDEHATSTTYCSLDGGVHWTAGCRR